MIEKKVLPTNDILFKKVFSSPQNSHILIGFINDILGLEVVEVTIENTYNIQSFYVEGVHPELKYTQVDVLARLVDGRLITIEMQLHKQALFRERELYYVSENYISNYGKHELETIGKGYTKGELKYSALRPVYSICIMAENEFPEDEEPIHKFRLYDEKNNMPYKSIKFGDLMVLVFLELKKYSEEMAENIKEWFEYFIYGQVSEKAPNYIKEACRVVRYQNLEKEEREMVDAREKAEQDALAREYYKEMVAEEKEKERKEKDRVLAEKEKAVVEKERVLEERKRKVEKEQNEVEKRQNEVEKRQNEVEKRQNEVEKKQNEVEKKQNEVEKKQNEVKERIKAIEEKELKVAEEKEKIENSIKKITQSLLLDGKSIEEIEKIINGDM